MTVILAILGLLAPFIPDVINMGKAAIDHKHEMAMLEKQIEASKDASMHRMEEIIVQAQAQENIAARRPHESYGVQLIDKASASQGVIWKWSVNFAFLAFINLDWLTSFVRPAVTYFIFGLYGATKISILIVTFTAVFQHMGGDSFFQMETINAIATTFTNEAALTEFDQELLVTIVAFWFGGRFRKRALQERNG